MRRSEQTRAEDTLLRDTSRRFLEDTYAWDEGRSRRADRADHWRFAAELGWFALGLPERLGGLEGDGNQLLSILEEAGRVLHDAPLLANVLLAPKALSAMNEAVAIPLAEKLAAGEIRFAYVPDGSVHLSRSTMRLEGRSGVALGAAEATHWLVAVGSRSVDGASLLLLPANDAVRRTDFRLIDGRSASTLHFEDLAIPDDAALARGETAFRLLEDLNDRAVIGGCAEAFGALEGGLGLTVDYLKQRTQFGAPLSSFQAVQHKMAESFCEIEQMRSLLLWGAVALDASPDERAQAASALKVFLGREGLTAASRCIQVSGGIGLTEDYRIGHVYKRLQTVAALFGSTEAHIARLGDLFIPSTPPA
ncbi:acyl-CoA dehydrogenase family protein [Microvirga aerilata]|uniref:Acyl-CoA dehydrogenase family protein n=1 Tax=Microvirga aerilata TaxID=670292 RepID=A0A936ZAC7_9HYPH|nr:acyl-CoA dehydrogenase [Microvirga aerilata]MBL0406012.1 acyl-CoA dehydrogenase family protein [Microvirga aerilata]